MSQNLTAVVSVAVLSAVLSLPGCSGSDGDAGSPSVATSPSESTRTAAAPESAPLPAPDALIGVLDRLADVAVPGPQKLNLVEGATPESAAVFDQFAGALINGGFTPVKFDVRDIRWSDRNAADVVANVDVSSTNPRGPHFAFPMEFKPYRGGWQLCARTADVLLAFRSDSAEPPTTPGR